MLTIVFLSRFVIIYFKKKQATRLNPVLSHSIK